MKQGVGTNFVLQIIHDEEYEKTFYILSFFLFKTYKNVCDSSDLLNYLFCLSFAYYKAFFQLTKCHNIDTKIILSCANIKLKLKVGSTREREKTIREYKI